MQQITILGSTGSIGSHTLDLVRRHPEKFQVYALTAHRNIDKLFEQCIAFRPKRVVLADAQSATQLQNKLLNIAPEIDVDYGRQALCEVASDALCDTVVAGIVGAAGLFPVMAAAEAGKKILLANKESLVMSGALFMNAVAKGQATLLPVDSEHSAIFQCLIAYCPQYAEAGKTKGVDRLFLTASGGPLLGHALSDLETVTPQEACAHPNWVMGHKISVDSATMMNKGLEVIEAHYLFGMPAERIEVVIHPQSIVHSMVAYADGSMLAQMGMPDMRTPIAYALAYPERIDAGVPTLDLARLGTLSFEPVEEQRFPCLQLAYEALSMGGTAGALLNAANEVAVQAFLTGKIRFTMIAQLIQRVLDGIPFEPMNTLEEAIEADQRARLWASEYIQHQGA